MISKISFLSNKRNLQVKIAKYGTAHIYSKINDIFIDVVTAYQRNFKKDTRPTLLVYSQSQLIFNVISPACG
jgi:N-acetyl-anhydromuramyl-L-alanine amidase AmpD